MQHPSKPALKGILEPKPKEGCNEPIHLLSHFPHPNWDMLPNNIFPIPTYTCTHLRNFFPLTRFPRHQAHLSLDLDPNPQNRRFKCGNGRPREPALSAIEGFRSEAPQPLTLV